MTEHDGGPAARKLEEGKLLKELEAIHRTRHETLLHGSDDALVTHSEHVGADRYREYARTLHALLRPGGRLLNHQ
ncbi:DUF6158 family protein, partial [Streptomyces sp. NPDC041003]|uniref:DUF6158 family protein n=1 Tax=Streptomyces sp. NPDC041003 TaxID=3155730 RepID=UPI0033D0DF66